ncbi:MAG: NAD(P)H-dependent oxidoreductase subunit E [Acidobacteria bacterium]|nr:NAD(P)H-dependent oxidoreductase subunit E [Acidobacteriota bacterium]
MTFHPKIDYRELHRSKRQMPVDDGQPFVYSPENRERLEVIARRYPPEPAGRRSAILPALYLVQRQLGYVSLSAVAHVAGVIGCTAADVEDVVSFYTMFYTRPVGQYVVQVCRTLPCALRGAERVTEELMDALGAEPGGADPSGVFTLMEVECLGACDRAPLVMINDSWHECLAPEDAKKLVDDLRSRGEDALTGCHHQAPDKGTQNSEPRTREPRT